MGSRIFIKLTFNEKDVFDAVILDYLKDKSKKAAHIKKLVYDRIVQLEQGRGQEKIGDAKEASPIHNNKNNNEDEQLNSKLDKLLNI